MSGEITIMGKLLGVGGIHPKLMTAIDAGVTTVILPRKTNAMCKTYLITSRTALKYNT